MLSGVLFQGRTLKSEWGSKRKRDRRVHRTLVAGVHRGFIYNFGRSVDDTPVVIGDASGKSKEEIESAVELYAQQHGFTSYSLS